MRFTTLTALAAATLLSTAAQAQDTVGSADASLPASQGTYAGPADTSAPTDIAGTFGGVRIEGNIGWDKMQAYGNNNEKMGYGGSVGFDGNLTNRIIVGPEFSYWRPNHGRNTVISDNGSITRQGREILGAAVRVGYRAGPDVILFAKAGYANQKQRTAFIIPGGNGAIGRYSDRIGGYQVGGGIQYAPQDRFSFVPANVYISAQYVYSQFDNRTSDQHAMAGIGFKFR